MSNTPGYSRAYTKKGKREIRKQFKSQTVGQNQRVNTQCLVGLVSSGKEHSVWQRSVSWD